MAQIILDTGPLVALIDRREEHHAWTVERLRSLRNPLLTCDAVLTEATFLLAEYPPANQALSALLRQRIVVSEFASQTNAAEIFRLMETYRNVPMSFADACLVCMVENSPGSTLFTLDRDFTVYRQQRRRVIPLIAPF